MAREAIIVGGGLFGRVIQKTLNTNGWHARVVDTFNRPFAGSGPAACLMRPSWASSMNGNDYKASINLLNELYGVKAVDLLVRPGGVKSIQCQWVNPNDILKLREDDIFGEVLSIGSTVDVRVLHQGHDNPFEKRYQADLIIVAAGIWTKKLLPQYEGSLTGKTGWAFVQPGQVEVPSIRLWMPYKQVVMFNRGSEQVWINDGVAVKEGSIMSELLAGKEPTILAKSRERCNADMEREHRTLLDGQTSTLVGIRPYYTGPKVPALCEPVVGHYLWVASGGAKNGTLGAAWSARKILEAVGCG